MIKMIKLTCEDGETVYVNPKKVKCIYCLTSRGWVVQAVLHLCGGEIIEVIENVSEIAKLVELAPLSKL